MAKIIWLGYCQLRSLTTGRYYSRISVLFLKTVLMNFWTNILGGENYITDKNSFLNLARKSQVLFTSYNHLQVKKKTLLQSPHVCDTGTITLGQR